MMTPGPRFFRYEGPSFAATRIRRFILQSYYLCNPDVTLCSQ